MMHVLHQCLLEMEVDAPRGVRKETLGEIIQLVTNIIRGAQRDG